MPHIQTLRTTVQQSTLITIPLLLLMLIACNTPAANPPMPTQDPTPTTPPADGTLSIDLSATAQTIEGFGVSGAWWAQDVGGWDDGTREQIIALLFDQESGIGLSIYRYNIGGGNGERIPDAWRRAETFEVAQGEYDWTRDANGMWVLRAVKAAGVEQFVAFANSPPARITRSGRTNSDSGTISNIDPEMYGQYAQYLVDIVAHLQNEEDIPIGWLSPINEPQWDWNVQGGQEGSHYEPDEVVALTRAVIEAIEANQLDVKLSVFEAGEWWNTSIAYLDPLLSDPVVAPYIDHIAVHSYWSTNDDRARLVRYLDDNYPDLAIEMTEWTEMESGREIRMPSGLVLANTIHNDLTIGRAVSWQYWIGVSKYTFHDGLVYVAVHNHSITETKRLWAMGNFSRYVRPGYQLIAADSSINSVKSSAFVSPDGNRLVIVVINNGDEAQLMGVEGVPAGFPHMTIHETSANHNLSQLYDGETLSQIKFPPESVTTVIFDASSSSDE